MNYAEIIEKLHEDFPDAKYVFDADMSEHTSFKIGGHASVMFIPESAEELGAILSLCAENNLRSEMIGNGTNILFADELPDMAVIKTTGGMDRIELIGETEIYAQCGATLSRIAYFALMNSLTGFEFAHGIPGSLGGAVVMNAGAYGGEIKDVVTFVDTLDGRFFNAECDFSYRHSRFSDCSNVVTGAAIRLDKGYYEEIKSKMDDLAQRRRSSQPLNMPSAGSTFKRPEVGYAAALIDQAGLKGFTIGGAQVSEKHAGFVVNTGSATFNDVWELMEHIKKTVYDISGIILEPEVKIIK